MPRPGFKKNFVGALLLLSKIPDSQKHEVAVHHLWYKAFLLLPSLTSRNKEQVEENSFMANNSKETRQNQI